MATMKKPGQRGYKPRHNATPAGQPKADMFSYDNALPCKNPNCKSHGKPHPNCQCYGSAKSTPQRRLTGLAKGGEVGNFCDSNEPHDPLCAYYAGGGEVPDWNSLSPTAPAQNNPAQKPDAAPDWESLSPSPPSSDGTPNWDDLKPAEDHYGSMWQQAIAGIEGAAKGVLGPLATIAETKYLGVPAQDIAGREEANPITHGLGEGAGLMGSMATGVGEGALAAGVAERLAPEALGKIGGTVLKGFITNGLIQGGDEISKGILGTGDPQAPVSAALAHMGAAGLFGGALGGVGSAASKALSAVGAQKLGTKAASLLAGLADASAESRGVPLPKMTYAGGQDTAAYGAGLNLYSEIPKILSNTMKGTAATAGTGVASKLGLPWYAGAYIGKQIGQKLGVALEGPTNQYVLPALLKALSTGESSGLLEAIDYAGDVSRGAQKMNSGITKLFQSGSQQVVDESTDRDHERIKKFISDGTLNQQIQSQMGVDSAQPAYAEGGEVKTAAPLLQGSEGMSKHFPTQNILMQAAKGRVNNYLNSLRPQENQARLPFDKKMQNKDSDRKYDKAVAIAAQPLSILNHLARGTLTPESLGHFTQMYPEIHGELSRRMTEKITHLQLKDEMIPYRLRQSMSLFLGSPLDSTLTPSAIQAAQAVYSQRPSGPPDPPVTKPKKDTSKLGKAAEDSYTSDQAAAKRQASLRP